MTGQQLADRVGVTKGAVSQWETGDTRNLRLEHLFKVADALEVNVRWLALGEGKQHKAAAGGLELEITEADAITHLRTALPDWRAYVLSLAKMEERQQELMLLTMRQAVPDYKVEAAFGKPPPPSVRKK